MYALFPDPARDYLTLHQEGAEEAVFMMGEEFDEMREDGEVDVNQIRELIKIVEMSDIGEVAVEEADMKVTIRGSGVTVAPVSAPVAGEAAVATAEAQTETATEAAPAADEGQRPASWKTVVSPMVGTFYRAPAPGADPFVGVGDEVAEGDTMCILEAMKLMNEIKAEEPGVIREIPADNAEAVEYGTVLFYYEPLG
jgi:oxaloacetate decarboxylase alpha subunit